MVWVKFMWVKFMWFGLSLWRVQFLSVDHFQKNPDRVLEASPFQRKWRGSESLHEDPNPSMTVLHTTSRPSINHWYLSHFLSRSLVVCLLPSFSFFLFFYNYVFCITLCAVLLLYNTSKYCVWVWEWHFCGCKFDKCGFLSFTLII